MWLGLEKVIKSPSLRNIRNRVVTNDRYAHITPKFTQKIKELTGGKAFLYFRGVIKVVKKIIWLMQIEGIFKLICV